MMNPASSFLGFERSKGNPGIRNHLLLLNLTGLTQPAAQRIQASIPWSTLVSMPHGYGVTGDNERLVSRLMGNLAGNPNVGAVLILSADRVKADRCKRELQEWGKPVESLALNESGRDILAFIDQAVRVGAHLGIALSRQSRKAFPLAKLCIGLECGMSDPSSGIAANPLIGHFSDAHVRNGGAVIFTETVEWIGCEQSLANRAADSATGKQILQAVHRREKLAAASGVDLLGNNPNQANIDAGLSTIEDKAINSTAKSGSGPIGSFLEFGERATKHCLHAMDGPSYTPESLTGLVAAGAQLILFTTGAGNSYVSALSPTIKVTGNADTASRLSEQIDFSCADILDNTLTIESALEALQNSIRGVASGTLTLGEVLREGDEVVSRFGESL